MLFDACCRVVDGAGKFICPASLVGISSSISAASGGAHGLVLAAIIAPSKPLIVALGSGQHLYAECFHRPDSRAPSTSQNTPTVPLPSHFGSLKIPLSQNVFFRTGNEVIDKISRSSRRANAESIQQLLEEQNSNLLSGEGYTLNSFQGAVAMCGLRAKDIRWICSLCSSLRICFDGLSVGSKTNSDVAMVHQLEVQRQMAVDSYSRCLAAEQYKIFRNGKNGSAQSMDHTLSLWGDSMGGQFLDGDSAKVRLIIDECQGILAEANATTIQSHSISDLENQNWSVVQVSSAGSMDLMIGEQHQIFQPVFAFTSAAHSVAENAFRVKLTLLDEARICLDNTMQIVGDAIAVFQCEDCQAAMNALPVKLTCQVLGVEMDDLMLTEEFNTMDASSGHDFLVTSHGMQEMAASTYDAPKSQQKVGSWFSYTSLLVKLLGRDCWPPASPAAMVQLLMLQITPETSVGYACNPGLSSLLRARQSSLCDFAPGHLARESLCRLYASLLSHAFPCDGKISTNGSGAALTICRHAFECICAMFVQAVGSGNTGNSIKVTNIEIVGHNGLIDLSFSMFRHIIPNERNSLLSVSLSLENCLSHLFLDSRGIRCCPIYDAGCSTSPTVSWTEVCECIIAVGREVVHNVNLGKAGVGSSPELGISACCLLSAVIHNAASIPNMHADSHTDSLSNGLSNLLVECICSQHTDLISAGALLLSATYHRQVIKSSFLNETVIWQRLVGAGAISRLLTFITSTIQESVYDSDDSAQYSAKSQKSDSKIDNGVFGWKHAVGQCINGLCTTAGVRTEIAGDAMQACAKGSAAGPVQALAALAGAMVLVRRAVHDWRNNTALNRIRTCDLMASLQRGVHSELASSVATFSTGRLVSSCLNRFSTLPQVVRLACTTGALLCEVHGLSGAWQMIQSVSAEGKSFAITVLQSIAFFRQEKDAVTISLLFRLVTAILTAGGRDWALSDCEVEPALRENSDWMEQRSRFMNTLMSQPPQSSDKTIDTNEINSVDGPQQQMIFSEAMSCIALFETLQCSCKWVLASMVALHCQGTRNSPCGVSAETANASNPSKAVGDYAAQDCCVVSEGQIVSTWPEGGTSLLLQLVERDIRRFGPGLMQLTVLTALLRHFSSARLENSETVPHSLVESLASQLRLSALSLPTDAANDNSDKEIVGWGPGALLALRSCIWDSHSAECVAWGDPISCTSKFSEFPEYALSPSWHQAYMSDKRGDEPDFDVLRTVQRSRHRLQVWGAICIFAAFGPTARIAIDRKGLISSVISGWHVLFARKLHSACLAIICTSLQVLSLSPPSEQCFPLEVPVPKADGSHIVPVESSVLSLLQPCCDCPMALAALFKLLATCFDANDRLILRAVATKSGTKLQAEAPPRGSDTKERVQRFIGLSGQPFPKDGFIDIIHRVKNTGKTLASSRLDTSRNLTTLDRQQLNSRSIGAGSALMARLQSGTRSKQQHRATPVPTATHTIPGQGLLISILRSVQSIGSHESLSPKERMMLAASLGALGWKLMLYSQNLAGHQTKPVGECCVALLRAMCLLLQPVFNICRNRVGYDSLSTPLRKTGGVCAGCVWQARCLADCCDCATAVLSNSTHVEDSNDARWMATTALPEFVSGTVMCMTSPFGQQYSVFGESASLLLWCAHQSSPSRDAALQAGAIDALAQIQAWTGHGSSACIRAGWAKEALKK